MAHSNPALSDLAIRRLKAGKTLADTGENRGLRVTKGKTGITSFFYRYRSPIDSSIKQVKIGSYPEMSLADARVALITLKAQRDSGICMATRQKADKLAREAERLALEATDTHKAFTVEAMVESYLRHHIEELRDKNGRVIRKGARLAKGAREVRRMLYGDVVRVLGQRPAIEITHKDVTDLIMSIVARGAAVQAGSVLRELTAAFDYALDDHVNPCYQAKAVLKRKKVRLTSARGSRVLSDSELKELLLWLPGSLYTPTQKNVLRFTLMTGCRTGEVVDAQWRDIDLDRAVWHVRENKTDTPRNVQLATQAIAFLRQLKHTTGEYLFPSQKTGKPIQQKSLTEAAWHMRKAKTFIELQPWTPHDLRRSVRTGLARLGCPNEVAEAILGHTRGGIEGVYNLHSYESEAKQWLQRWNDHLEALTHER